MLNNVISCHCVPFLYAQVEFQVIDGSYLTSLPIVVHVSIRTSETNAPRVSWNVGTSASIYVA